MYGTQPALNVSTTSNTNQSNAGGLITSHEQYSNSISIYDDDDDDKPHQTSIANKHQPQNTMQTQSTMHIPSSSSSSDISHFNQLRGTDPILAKRMLEIQTREENIMRLEAELDEFELELKRESKGITSVKNWPLKNWAIARNDIALDIPVKYQRSVRKFYTLWWWTAICTFLNWICMIWWASDNGAQFSKYLFATLYVVVGCPLSWTLMYKRFYRAMQSNGDISWLFFIFLLLHMMWCGIMALGFEGTVSAGWLLMAKQFVNGDDALAFAILFSAVFWSVNVLATLYLMRVAHYHLGMYLAKKYAHFDE